MDFTVLALDGIPLAADLHLPPHGVPRAVALLAPAMGVPRRFYRPFARFLADAGVAVLVCDYRGIGDSRPHALPVLHATLHDWADLDLAGALAFLRAEYPDLPVTWIGHSVGGQLLGLLPDPPVARALLIASQHGHWRNWPAGLPRASIAALWWAVIPTVVAVTGRIPAALFGGEALPAGVASEWARWGRDPDHAVGFARRRGPSGFDSFRGELLAYAFTDDPYAPPSTVRPLVEAFTAARTEQLTVAPARLGVERIGHFGALRPEGRPLWEEWRDWLLEAASSSPREAWAQPARSAA